MNQVALKIDNVSKNFKKKQILKNLSFETYEGEVFGFLGPNGAGKTTLIKLIVGLLTLEDGTITICGSDINKNFEDAMANVGGIVENPELYKYMTGRQNLMQYANMRMGITKERIDEVVELVGLSNRIDEKVGKYSLGMRQRLGLAQSLLHRPKVLILDEPTNGLDPAGIKQLRDILKNVAHNEGTCVMVSSHLMSEMELMCDRVGIIVRGELRSVQTVEEMVRSMDGSKVSYQYCVNDSKKAADIIGHNFDVEADEIEILSEKEFIIELQKETAEENIADINAIIINNNIRLYSVSRMDSHSLEEAFIELTSEGGDQIA